MRMITKPRNGAALSVLQAASWGVGGRRFKSSRADQKSLKNQPIMAGFFLIVFYAEKYRGIIGVKHL